jgi:hypothetical protein
LGFLVWGFWFGVSGLGFLARSLFDSPIMTENEGRSPRSRPNPNAKTLISASIQAFDAQEGKPRKAPKCGSFLTWNVIRLRFFTIFSYLQLQLGV